LKPRLIAIAAGLAVSLGVLSQAAPSEASPSRAVRSTTVHPRLASRAAASERRRHVRRRRRGIRPVLSAHPSRDRARKRAAERRYRRALRRGRHGKATPTLRRIGVFGSLNTPGLSAGNASPSDSTGAIGPANYLEVVNSRVAVFDRNLLPVNASGQPDQAALDAFVNLPGWDVGDPQIQWDQQSQRWYYLTYATQGSTNGLAYGWSKTSDPSDLGSGGWCKLLLDTGVLFPDFPKLGHDDGHLIFGANAFGTGLGGIPTDQFATALVYTVPKPATNDTSCTAGAAQQFPADTTKPLPANSGAPDDAAFAPVPANTTDASAAGYVVAADYPSALSVWQVVGQGAQTQLVPAGEVPVPQFDFPAQAPQPGSVYQLDTMGAQLTQAVGHRDPDAGAQAVWTQHTVAGAGGRSVMRWYELVPSNVQQPLRQVGTVSDPVNFVFNGAVSPAGDGRDAAVEYNVSGPAQPVAIRARARPGGAPAGYMGQELGLVTSSAALLDHTCGPSTATAANPGLCRWGDYSGASPDPLNDRVVWGTSQYSGGSDWLSRNFAIQVLPGPIAQATGSPNPVTTGQVVTFDSSGTTDPDSGVVHHLWDLDGNGTYETDTGSSSFVTHVYSAAGTVTVRFRALDANGEHGDTSLMLTVKAPPPPVRPSGPSAACLAARRRVNKLVHQVHSLRSRVKHTRNRRSRRRYANQLKQRRADLAKAQKSALQTCR